MSEVTTILSALEKGHPRAAEQLLPLVYDELRKLAASKLAEEKPGQTLQATALVHEAYLRLVASPGRKSGDEDEGWDNRGHFFAAAAEAMRRILIDRARSKRAIRHGGDQQRVELEEANFAVSDHDADQLMAVSEALDKLAAVDGVEAELVKLRYFVGLTIDDAAAILGVSPRTAKNYWTHARAWLFQEIKKGIP
jgi:RNA polymerase sigma factor (TIGR02999 family)